MRYGVAISHVYTGINVKNVHTKDRPYLCVLKLKGTARAAYVYALRSPEMPCLRP